MKPGPYPHRLTIDITSEQYSSVSRLVAGEPIGIADLLRATIDLLDSDPKLADRLMILARAGAEQRKARRRPSA